MASAKKTLIVSFLRESIWILPLAFRIEPAHGFLKGELFHFLASP